MCGHRWDSHTRHQSAAIDRACPRRADTACTSCKRHSAVFASHAMAGALVHSTQPQGTLCLVAQAVPPSRCRDGMTQQLPEGGRALTDSLHPSGPARQMGVLNNSETDNSLMNSQDHTRNPNLWERLQYAAIPCDNNHQLCHQILAYGAM